MIERDQVRFGSTLIEYTVVRSGRRRKTVEITLDPADGILVAAPADTPPERIRQVVGRRSAWIVQRASAQVLQPRHKAFVSGESLPYLGRQARLFVEHADLRHPRLAFRHWSFHLTVPAHLTGEPRRTACERAVLRWYRTRAQERLAARTQLWAGRAGYGPTAVLIRDQRQRWGSCGPDGTLRFNWRIILAPPALIDYVVVHELVHLRARTHSAAFWSEVARLMPDYALRRMRLKEMGPELAI